LSSPSKHEATVHLDSQHNVGKIDRRIFGGFLEHLGRAVYEGVFDPGNPLSDERGFRRDVIAALKPLAMPVMRYPGGNYVSACDWKDGVGPSEKRPKRPDYAWQSIESNQFGTNEFMQWCRAAGTEPMMAVNLGTAGATEAAQLLEYCNLPVGTLWSDKRKEHGYADPYNVKLWCLGNEMDGPWQAGHVPAEVYAQRAFQASFLMKGLDSSIETIVCGSSARSMPTYMDWDRKVLEYCWPTVDYISAHRYSDNSRNDTAWFLAEGVEIDRVIADYAALTGYVRALKKNDKHVYLSFDEWNVWYRARSGAASQGGWKEAPPLLEEHYNLEDALVCAQYLAAFVRRADFVKVGCIAQIVNVIAPILTRRDGLLIQSIYYPFLHFSQHAHGLSLVPVIQSPNYKAGERGEVPVLDACASLNENGDLAIFLTNRNSTDALGVTISLADLRATAVIGGEVLAGEDPKVGNTWENPSRVRPQSIAATLSADSSVQVTVPPLGYAVVRVKTEKR
jgi:alpha-N-arabinofuranosidase